jgi:hypothetical protein
MLGPAYRDTMEVTKPMNAVQAPGRPYAAAPFFIQFRPADGKGRDIWTVKLDADILTLLKPGDKAVLHLHRDEAARYLKFSYDLVRGRILTFHVIEGLKSYSFPCTKVQMLKLVSWMPHKEHSEIESEVRVSGVGVLLFGILHVLLSANVWVGWGLALLALGVSGVCAPKRGMYGTNGALMLVAGLGDLIASSFMRVPREGGFFDPALIPVAVGILLIVWGIHQLSMLGPNQLLRAARAIRDRQAALFPVESRVVRRIALFDFVAGVIFGAYAIALLGVGGRFRLEVLMTPHEWTPDLAAFGALSLVCLASAITLVLRRRPAYFEAKVTAQMLLGVIVVSLWGLGVSAVTGRAVAAFGDAFSLDNVAYAPVAWVLLILWVSVFNRWYSHAVDRELEEQRD